MQWQNKHLPSVSHDYHTQLVAKVLHFMNLYKCSHLVDFVQILNHVRFITIEEKKLEEIFRILSKQVRNIHWLENSKVAPGTWTLCFILTVTTMRPLSKPPTSLDSHRITTGLGWKEP